MSLKDISRPNKSAHGEDPTIEISGFTIAEKLELMNVVAKELVLVSSRVEGRLTAPIARTDNPVWALQLKLAGINVDVGTEVARKMLAKGSFSAQLAGVA